MERLKYQIAGFFVGLVVVYNFGLVGAMAQVETSDQLNARAPTRPTLSIETRIDDQKWQAKKAVYPLRGQEIALRVKPVMGGRIRWYLVFADLTKNYKNANHPWETDAYKWVGVEKIVYHRVELTLLKDKWVVQPFGKGAYNDTIWTEVVDWFKQRGEEPWKLTFYHGDVGTFWFQAEVDKGDRVLRSHGILDNDDKGISRRVTRVSIRDGAGYLGWVASFYNVPGVFGSVLSQSRNYIGADCADLLMSALSRWRKKKLTKNVNVQMLVGRYKKVAEFEMLGGVPDRKVTWNQIQPGDFIAVRYGGGKKFHHIGVLERDEDQNNRLDCEDTALHAGPYPLNKTKLKHGAFDGHVVILRY